MPARVRRARQAPVEALRLFICPRRRLHFVGAVARRGNLYAPLRGISYPHLSLKLGR